MELQVFSLDQIRKLKMQWELRITLLTIKTPEERIQDILHQTGDITDVQLDKLMQNTYLENSDP